MTKVSKIWAILFLIASLYAIAGPIISPCFGDGLKSEEPAYALGGPLGLGYDYIGKAIAPQLLTGGFDLLFASLLTAFISRIANFLLGTLIAIKNKVSNILRFFLDICLVLPASLVSSACYQTFGDSIYSIVPIVCVLNLPFSSGYYEKSIAPILTSTYFEYALIRKNSILQLIRGEILPILLKTILTDIS